MASIVVNPKCQELADFVNNLPRTFTDGGEIIHAGRNIVKVFDVDGRKINVKSFKVPIFINQIAYTTFRESKARRSYKYALTLIEKGFNTPAPVAYVEQTEFWLLKNSFYVSLHEHFDGIMKELKTGVLCGREDLIKQFAIYTANLHEKQILHLDYSPGNILYKKEGEHYIFYLVDLNRMQFDKPIDINIACYNFRRLWGSDEMIRFFVEEYANVRNFDVQTCLTKTFTYRKEFWDKFVKKHPHASPYITANL